MDALQADPEYAAAEREHRLVLDELRQLYLIRLDHALQAESAVTARTDGHAHTLAMAVRRRARGGAAARRDASGQGR